MLTVFVTLSIVLALLVLVLLWLVINERHRSARLERARLKACEKAEKTREEMHEAVSAQQEHHAQVVDSLHSRIDDLGSQLAAANSWLELFLTAEETDEEGTFKINRARAAELFRRTKS